MDYQELIHLLETSNDTETKTGTKRLLSQLTKIFSQLEQRNIDFQELEGFAQELQSVLSSSPYSLSRLSQIKTRLTAHLKKEHGLTTKGYHQNLWMILGMTMFGVPLGMIFGFALDNFGLFAIGLPMGMPIGMGIGMAIDKKAQEAGTVLDI